MEDALARLHSLREKYQCVGGANGTSDEPSGASHDKAPSGNDVPPSPNIDVQQLKKRLADLKPKRGVV